MTETRNRAATPQQRKRTSPARPASRGPGDSKNGAAFEVIQSKLAIPSLRSTLVRRTALVNRLRASETRVVRVVAPAGYGKTTLLAQWAARDPRPFAWVSLDERDNDPAAFLTYLAAALKSVRRIDSGVFRAAASGRDSMWSTGVPRLGAALASMPEPIVLVVDDVQELRDRDCLEVFRPLSKHLRPGSQLVLSGRAEDGLPLARLRTSGQLLEIGRVDLALSDAQASSLLAAAGVKVSDAEARELNERAEGWAAGLYLAALFMQELGDSRATSSFHGSDRFVADYLRSEHLSRLKRADVKFLTRTAVVDQMCGDLCDELLERRDSARRLQALEEANFFVVPLDRHREWYRYHHLFRDMLLSELERLEPGLAPLLHRRAASWFDRHGQPEAAIEHAAAGGDLDEVARLVSTCALPFYRDGRVATVERWLSWFDDPKILEGYPAVAAFGAWVNALRGRPDDAERFAHALEHHSPDAGPMLDGSTSPRPWAAMVRALLCHHGIDAMQSDAQRALEELAPSSFWRPISLLLLGVALLLEGEVERAEEILTRTAEEAVGAGAIYAGIVAHSELALTALARRDRARAELELEHAREFVENQPVEDYLPAALYLAASARLALASGHAATARTLLVSAMRMRPQLTRAIPWFGVQVKLELARAHLALADVDGAQTLLREVEDVFRHRPDLGALGAQARELRTELANAGSIDHGWASTLTAAELRLLPLLTTHLSFREIAERLYVSRNTVKSQAISVYRKLDASSRSEAIDRAVELGLVDAPVASVSGFTPSG
jgi:LuxR family transcriptional regulator, maltose regulon positive regulatory protein